MPPLSPNLKKALIVVEVIIGILGAFWLAISIFIHGVYQSEPENSTLLGIQSFSIMYVIGIIMISLSAVAVYGTLKEKQWILILCTLVMSALSALFLVTGIPSAILSPLAEEFVSTMLQEAKNNMTEDIRQEFEFFQKMFYCCGFDNGVCDWGDDIPLSCRCPSSPQPYMQCVNVTVEEGEVLMYGQPCYQFLVYFYQLIFNVTTGVSFSYLMFLIVGVALSAAVVCQIR